LIDHSDLLSVTDIERAFSAADSLRKPRVAEMVKEDIQVQRLSVWASEILGEVDRRLVSLVPIPILVDQLSVCYTRSYRSKALADLVKPRPRTIPIPDELLTIPTSRGWWTLAAGAAYALLVSLELHGFVYVPTSDRTPGQLDNAASTHEFESYNTRILEFEAVRIDGLLLNYDLELGALFAAPEAWDAPPRVPTSYLNMSELVVFASWMAEIASCLLDSWSSLAA